MSAAPSETPPADPCRLCAEKGRKLGGRPIAKQWAPGAVGLIQVCLVCDANPIIGSLGFWGGV